MIWDQLKANLKQFKGRLKEKWGKLIHHDRTTIAGKLQEKYACDKAQSEKELEVFAKSLEPKNALPPA